MPTKKRKKKADLKDLEVDEVSLVDMAANGEDFVIIKAADGDVEDVSEEGDAPDNDEAASPFAGPMNALGDAYDASIALLKGKDEVDGDSKAAVQDLILKGSAELKRLAEIAGIEHEDTLDPLSKASAALTDDTPPTPPTPPTEAAPAKEAVAKSSDADRLATIEETLVGLPDAIAKAFEGFGAQVTEQIKTQVATQIDAKTEAAVAPLRKSVSRLRNREATSSTAAVDDDTRSGGDVLWPSDMAPKLP